MANGTVSAYSNIKAKYPAPTDPRVYVDTLSNLITRTTKYFWENMLVFIKSEKSLYYLKDGAVGDNLIDWEKMDTAEMRFVEYTNIAYDKGATVSVGTSMYIAKENVTDTESPISTPTKWLALGVSEYYYANFTNVDTIVVTHTVSQPIVYLCDVNGYEIIGNIQKTDIDEITVLFSENVSGSITIK